MNQKDNFEQKRPEVRDKKPMAHFSNAINHAMFGDLKSLTQGSLLSRIVGTLIIIGILLIAFRCSSPF